MAVASGTEGRKVVRENGIGGLPERRSALIAARSACGSHCGASPLGYLHQMEEMPADRTARLGGLRSATRLRRWAPRGGASLP